MERQPQVIRGRTEQEAMEIVRARWGEQVEVVSRRMVCEGIWNRMWGWREFEIQAIPLPPVPQRPPLDPECDTVSAGLDLEQISDDLPPSFPELEADEVRRHLQHGLGGSRTDAGATMLEYPTSFAESDESDLMLHDAFRQMVASGAPESDARALIQRVYDLDCAAEMDDPEWVRAAIAQVLWADFRRGQDSGDAQREPVPPTAAASESAQPPRPAVVAMVGPSGTGKTSLLVKLAAQLRLGQGRRVALVSADTFRVAAAEQLRCLAELLDAPLDIVNTPREMARVLRQRQEFEVVLLDTAGRNPRDQVAMTELQNLLNQARPDHVHLVLSATDAAAHLHDCAKAFQGVGATCLAFTRLDEARCLGNLIPLVRSVPLPWSYTTSGQNFKNDLQSADLRPLLPRMLGGHVTDLAVEEEQPAVMALSAWNGQAEGLKPSASVF